MTNDEWREMVRLGADEFARLLDEPKQYTLGEVVEAILAVALRGRTVVTPKPAPAPPPQGKFDKAAWQKEYMKDYMKKRRAAAKLIPQ